MGEYHGGSGPRGWNRGNLETAANGSAQLEVCAADKFGQRRCQKYYRMGDVFGLSDAEWQIPALQELLHGAFLIDAVLFRDLIDDAPGAGKQARPDGPRRYRVNSHSRSILLGQSLG